MFYRGKNHDKGDNPGCTGDVLHRLAGLGCLVLTGLALAWGIYGSITYLRAS